MFGLFNKVKKSLSVYKALIYLVSKIKPEKFDTVFMPMHSMTNIETLYLDVSTYTEALKTYIKKTTTDEYIAAYNIATTIQTIPISRWFIKDDKYLDPVIQMSDFLSVAKECIELYEHYSYEANLSYNRSKNLATHKHIVNNLLTLLTELKDI